MSNYEKKEEQENVDVEAVGELHDEEETKTSESLPDDDSDDVSVDAADIESEGNDEIVDQGEAIETDENESETSDILEEAEEVEEQPGKKHRKFKKAAAITAGSILGLALLVYLGLAFFFQNHYYFFTEINGVDFSGKTVKNAEAYIENQVMGYELTLKELDGGEEKISGSEIGLSYQPAKELEQCMKRQNPFLWPQAFWKQEKITTGIDVKFDEALLDEKIKKLAIMQPENQTPPVSAAPVFNGNEYEIKAETAGTQIDGEVLQGKVKEYITAYKQELDIAEEKCYLPPRFTKESPEVTAAKDTLNGYLKASVTYDLKPDTEVVDKKMISQWLSVDENMAVAVKRDLVAAYVADLASRYDTVGTARTIQTPTGKSAKVYGGSYGWKMDQEAETETLIGNITKGEQVTREPVFSRRAVLHAANDWGNTFVEVDLSAQHVWFISNGKNVFESSVVTGKPDGSHDTPAGIFSILEKMRDKVLRGNIMPNGEREYETPVAYWMRVTWSGVGFHDATWQAAFGGTRYRDGYGSHGCINMPYGKAAALYDMVYVGVPVIIHY